MNASITDSIRVIGAASILGLASRCKFDVVYTVEIGLNVHVMISPDLSIGGDPSSTMIIRHVVMLCFARIRANLKINLPDLAARMVISVGA
jgi:hypothetical protein